MIIIIIPQHVKAMENFMCQDGQQMTHQLAYSVDIHVRPSDNSLALIKIPALLFSALQYLHLRHRHQARAARSQQ